MDRIIISFIIDNNLVYQIMVVMLSIMKHLSIPVHFCILTNEESNKKHIESVLTTNLGSVLHNNYEVCVLNDMDTKIMKEVYRPESRTDLTYFIYSQFYICKYFSHYKKILFMEPDQIVRKDLAVLWEKVWKEDMKLAAVKTDDAAQTLHTLKTEYPNKEVKLYNAGVMILDTEYWNKNNFTELCLVECIKQKVCDGGRYNFYQEGAMNIALQNHFTELDKKYNYMNLGCRTDHPVEEIEQAVILHWNGYGKPWYENGLNKKYYTLV